MPFSKINDAYLLVFRMPACPSHVETNALVKVDGLPSPHMRFWNLRGLFILLLSLGSMSCLSIILDALHKLLVAVSLNAVIIPFVAIDDK